MGLVSVGLWANSSGGIVGSAVSVLRRTTSRSRHSFHPSSGQGRPGLLAEGRDSPNGSGRSGQLVSSHSLRSSRLPTRSGSPQSQPSQHSHPDTASRLRLSHRVSLSSVRDQAAVKRCCQQSRLCRRAPHAPRPGHHLGQPITHLGRFKRWMQSHWGVTVPRIQTPVGFECRTKEGKRAEPRRTGQPRAQLGRSARADDRFRNHPSHPRLRRVARPSPAQLAHAPSLPAHSHL